MYRRVYVQRSPWLVRGMWTDQQRDQGLEIYEALRSKRLAEEGDPQAVGDAGERWRGTRDVVGAKVHAVTWSLGPGEQGVDGGSERLPSVACADALPRVVVGGEAGRSELGQGMCGWRSMRCAECVTWRLREQVGDRCTGGPCDRRHPSEGTRQRPCAYRCMTVIRCRCVDGRSMVASVGYGG